MPLRESLRPTAHFLARFGSFSIGTVYCLIGIWALLALLRIAEPAADEERIIQRMAEFPAGKAFISLLALGALGYILWRLFEAVFDPYEFGASPKGLAQRVGVALSALVYGFLCLSVGEVLLGVEGNGEAERQLLVGRILGWPGGEWMIGTAGILVGMAGLYQIKYVYDGAHRERMRMDDLSPLGKAAVNVLGWTGHVARCIILLVLSWFLLDAARSGDPAAVGDTDTAFDFLGGIPFGHAVFAFVAVGTVAYGVFTWLNGVFYYFDDEDGH